jgi:hypothetical protein
VRCAVTTHRPRRRPRQAMQPGDSRGTDRHGSSPSEWTEGSSIRTATRPPWSSSFRLPFARERRSSPA